MLYASNISASTKAPTLQNLCHGLVSSTVVLTTTKDTNLWYESVTRYRIPICARWAGGLHGERIHVAEALPPRRGHIRSGRERRSRYRSGVGEELAVGHLRQVHHEVFAVVSEEVVNDGGVLVPE